MNKISLIAVLLILSCAPARELAEVAKDPIVHRCLPEDVPDGLREAVGEALVQEDWRASLRAVVERHGAHAVLCVAEELVDQAVPRQRVREQEK